MNRFLVLCLIVKLPSAVFAQGFPHHNFNVGFGAGIPRADIGSFFDPKPGLSVGYGYRFHRYFQADLGFEAIFGSANVHDFQETFAGYRRIRDFQYLLPFGGRAILPLAHGRMLVYGGGGGAYLRYQEHLSQPSEYIRIDCPTCASRSGWGYYATAGFTVFFDRYQRFRLGIAPRVYRGHTNGDPLGTAPGFRTRDQWLNVMGEFGVSF